MCGLFGIISYGKLSYTSLERIVEELGNSSTVRGTDATGIAYLKNTKGKTELIVQKEPVSAFKFKFRVPVGTKVVMGHTRNSTKGDEKFNYNNHPFRGRVGGTRIALAHNGVLDNDEELRKEYKLPDTKIETDSYVAVQMLETQQKFDENAIRFMAERVEGMFTFTILDDENNLWVVKNDSPFVIAHIKALEVYVYASTEDILFEAISNTGTTRSIIVNAFKKKSTDDIELIYPEKGDILKISPNGKITKFKFSPVERLNKWLYKYPYKWGYDDCNVCSVKDTFSDDEYIQQVRAYAEYVGLYDDEIDLLRSEGFTWDEIEEAIYDGTVWDYLDEIERSMITLDNISE